MQNFTFSFLQSAKFLRKNFSLALHSFKSQAAVLLVFLFLFGSKVSFAQPLADWELYRNITLSAATPMADYQVRVVLSVGEYQYMKPDGSDILFYEGDNTSNTPCSYWIEKWNNVGQSVIWVKVPTTGTTQLTMYYGNPAATATSDGDATFDFFDDFTTLNSAIWDYGAGVTQSGSLAGIPFGNFISNINPFSPPSSTFIMETKHKETSYHRVRYYATKSKGNNSTEGDTATTLTSFDYGYFAASSSSSGYIFWSVKKNENLSAETFYITQWQIKDDDDPGSFKWSTFDYDNNYSLIGSYNTSISGTLRHITIRTQNGTTSVDWVRLRKSDGNDDISGTSGIMVIRNAMSITSISPLSFACEGSTITITGTGFKSVFNTVNPVIQVGGTPVSFVSMNPSGTEIVGLLNVAPALGKVTVTNAYGTVTSATDFTVHQLPTVSAGLPLSYICQGGTSEPLGGLVGGGATDGTWTVDIAGGTFNGTSYQNMTWTSPASFTGTATFTLTTSGGSCGTVTATKTVEVRSVHVEPFTWPDLTACEGTQIPITGPFGYNYYDFRRNNSSFQGGTAPFASTPLNTKYGDIISLIVTQTNGCKVTYTAPPANIREIPAGNLFTSETTGVSNNDNIICQGDAVNFLFDADDPSKALSYTYDFRLVSDNSQLYGGSSPYVTSTSIVNDDQVKLTVNNQGCTKEFLSGKVTVNALPIPGLTSNPSPAALCVGDPITFTATGGTSYSFWVNITEMQPNGAADTYTTSALVNNDEVKVVVKNDDACYATSTPIPVIIYTLPAQPLITHTGTLTFCNDAVGTPPTLHATAGSSYQWYKDGEAISVGATSQDYIVPKDVNSTGDYTVVVTNANGCFSVPSAPVTVVVNPPATKPVVTAVGQTTFCIGGSVNLSSTTATNYQWYSDANTGSPQLMSGETSQVLNVNASGYYAVSVVNANGCSSDILSDPVQVVVNSLPQQPVISATGGKLAFCDGDNTILNADVSGQSYQWYQNGAPISGAVSQSYTTVSTLAAAGGYTVTVTDVNGCVSPVSTTETITVHALPVPTVTGANPICPGTTETYITESGNGIHDYVWTYTGGTLQSGGGTSDNQITITWDQPGSKTVMVNYTDVNGCSASESQTVQTSNSPLPGITSSPANTFDVCINYTGNVYTTEPGNSNYVWAVTGGTVTSGGGANDNTVTITWDTEGTQSVSVNYENGAGCMAAAPTTYTVSVNPLPIADFSYGGSPYCTDAVNPLPTMGSGAQKGVFTASPAGLSINASTGEINISGSTPGIYTVTNTIAAAKGCNLVDATSDVTITQKPTATIGYAGTPFCTSDNSLQAVTWANTAAAFEGGSFSASASLNIDAGNGDINPSLSNPGAYTVTYTIPASDGCGAIPVTTSVVVTELPVPTISYISNAFCVSDVSDKVPTRSGSGDVSGGSFSAAPAGLSLNPTTGNITPNTSTPGTYIVTYEIPARNGCGQVTATFEVTITAVPTASISYINSPFCTTETAIAVNLSGQFAYENGTFSSTAGLVINSTDGTINPSTSTPGSYTITYQTPSTGGCAFVQTTTTVAVTAAPTVTAGNDLDICADGVSLDITGGAYATNHSGITWSTSGDGTFSNPNSLTGNIYTLGANDKSAAAAITLTLTVGGNANCASKSDTKILMVNELPDQVMVYPASTEFCEGTIQPLTSVKNNVTSGSPVFNSSPDPVTIPENNFTGISKDIVVSGIPANAVIGKIEVKFNITHPNDKDLIANLRSPIGKEINLFSNIGGSGANFTNTVISNTALQPIQTFGSAPFTDEYSPQYVLGAMGAAFATSFSALYNTASSLNGTWKFKVSDMTGGNTGTFDNWSITIYYSIPIDPIQVIWSPINGLFTDASAETPYTGELLSTVYTKVTHAGTNQYIATTQNDAKGCRNSTEVNVIVREAPSVLILSDYCSNPDKVLLTASATGGSPFTYNWNNGTVGNATSVDEAHDYYVSATNVYGCVGTAVMSVAKELVVNGDFEAGYIVNGFVTDYTYVAPIGSLTYEGRYAIDEDAHPYHNNFFGRDHTTAAQTGKFMIVNGYPATANKIIWEQTVAVEPNTRYYYSAWAMNLNSVAPFARLQFEVNGEKIGTIAELASAPKPTDNSMVNVNNWVRFYYGGADGWYSDTNTKATIRIVNLETAVSGNDFGLDDISFATLSPFLRAPEDGTDEQLGVCSGTPIQTITYTVGTGLTGPEVDGLPPGITHTYDGLNFRISGTPVNNTNSPITYDYTVTTLGCTSEANSKTVTGRIVVLPDSKVELTSEPETLDQSLCIDLPINAVTFKTGGGITGFDYAGLPAGVTPNWNNGQLSLTGSPTVSGTFNYQIDAQGNSCSLGSVSGVMKISPKSKAGALNSVSVCLGESGMITLNPTGQIGEVLTWQISNDGVNYTDISGSAGVASQSFTNVTQSTSYRVLVKNEFCPDPDISNIGKVRINNLWEGSVSDAWEALNNWSSGNLPTLSSCSNTITIPSVPANRYDPLVKATVTASAHNLNLLSGSHLTINGGKLQIAGEITNNGGILDARHGEVEYNGSTAQTIQPGIFNDNAINDFKISNSNTATGVNLAAPIDVYRSLTFSASGRKLNTNGNLTLKSTYDETAWVGGLSSSHSINGDVTVERYINSGTTETPTAHGKSWQLLAVPTTGQSIRDSWMEGATKSNISSHDPGGDGNPNPGYGTMTTSDVSGAANFLTPGFDAYTPSGPSIKAWNPNTGKYEGPSSTVDPVYDQRGWMVFVRGDRSVYAYNQAAVPTTLRTKGALFTAETGKKPPVISVGADRIQSIGNPYASAIDLKKVGFTNNIGDHVTVWDPNLHGSEGMGLYVYLEKDGSGKYVPTPPTPRYPAGSDNNIIQSGQAFMVQTSVGQSGTITFTESNKVSGSNATIFRSGGDFTERNSQLRTNLYGVEKNGNIFIADGTLVMFDPSYSNDIDRMDARKMINTSENLAILHNETNLAVEKRNAILETDTIFYKLFGTRVQSYRFEFIADNLTKFGKEGFLEDRYLNTRIPISMEGSTYYDFSVENKTGSNASDRFRIVFREAAKPLAATFVDINAVQKVSDIVVSWKVEGEMNEREYEVEKSTDGIFFTKVTSLPARNTGSVVYTWTDKNVMAGHHYYRIKKINNDNNLSLSTIAKVLVFDNTASIKVTPNPIVGGVIQLHFANQPTGKYMVRLLNSAGQLIVAKQVVLADKISIERLKWDYTLAHGIYSIEITKPDGSLQMIKVMY